MSRCRPLEEEKLTGLLFDLAQNLKEGRLQTTLIERMFPRTNPSWPHVPTKDYANLD